MPLKTRLRSAITGLFVKRGSKDTTVAEAVRTDEQVLLQAAEILVRRFGVKAYSTAADVRLFAQQAQPRTKE